MCNDEKQSKGRTHKDFKDTDGSWKSVCGAIGGASIDWKKVDCKKCIKRKGVSLCR